MIDRDPETFTSTRFVNLEEVDDDYIALRRSMLESDGTRHQALRKLLRRDFSGRMLQRYEEFLRGLTVSTLTEALRELEFDFVERISADLPIQVLARLLPRLRSVALAREVIPGRSNFINGIKQFPIRVQVS